MKAFTYLIGWKSLNKFYYGVRYSKNCSPGDLWKTYFTSSKYVQAFREINGEPDIIEVRRIFNNKKSAIIWEQKVLSRLKVPFNDSFLNRNVGGYYGDVDYSMRSLKNNNFINNNPMKNPASRNKLSDTRKSRRLGVNSSKYLPKLRGDLNPMRNPEIIQKYKNKITGRKRKYRSDGTWFWSYVERVDSVPMSNPQNTD